MALDYQIDSVRLEPSDDTSHMHIALVGYESSHTPGEPIMIPPSRVLQKMAMGERFHIRVGDDRVLVTRGTCPLCGFEPYLLSEADQPGQQLLLRLPQK